MLAVTFTMSVFQAPPFDTAASAALVGGCARWRVRSASASAFLPTPPCRSLPPRHPHRLGRSSLGLGPRLMVRIFSPDSAWGTRIKSIRDDADTTDARSVEARSGFGSPSLQGVDVGRG